jgi:hypothetical protein
MCPTLSRRASTGSGKQRATSPYSDMRRQFPNPLNTIQMFPALNQAGERIAAGRLTYPLPCGDAPMHIISPSRAAAP